jgi:hypothetical protein
VQLESRGQPRAAVQVGRVAPAIGPFVRGPGEVTAQPAVRGVLLEPGREPRPLGQQRLMRELRGLVVDRDQPALGQVLEHRGDVPGGRVEFLEGDAAAHRDAALVVVGQAEEEAPGGPLLRRREGRVRRLGEPGDGAAHAAGALVGGERQSPAVALAPQLEQRGREQRQRSRLALEVAQQRLDQRGLGVEAGARGGRLDRPLEGVAARRADEQLVGGDELREPGMRRTAVVEVGPDGQNRHYAAAAVAAESDERVEEALALALVRAGRERLLELVDDQHDGAVRRHALELRRRVLARPHQDPGPAGAAGKRAGGERRQQPGPDGRGLAATGRADHGQRLPAREPPDHLLDERLAPEEVARVVGLEGGESLERAYRCGGGGPLAGRGLLAQDRRLQIAQLCAGLQAEVRERAAGVVVGGERLRLAAGAVQRQHPLGVQPLA